MVGGQFGSEGKGKTALEIVRRTQSPTMVIRVGGPNSGHTGYDLSGNRHILRQLPAACVDKNVEVVLPSGAFIDVEVLLEEIRRLDFPREKIHVSGEARVILSEHRAWEREANLPRSIGSTGVGVGAAVMAAVARGAANFKLRSESASQNSALKPFVTKNLSGRLRSHLQKGNRVVVEGTQGFGLCLMHGGCWPYVTSRCTTAAGALAEAGLGPTDVDDVTLVIRTFPIRVPGDSGPLAHETTWQEVSRTNRRSANIREFTSVTGQLRRVAAFDPKIVKRAIVVNRPTRLVLNHLDYIGEETELAEECGALNSFLQRIESSIEKRIDWLGFSGRHFVVRECKGATPGFHNCSREQR